jgi:ligand-binding sensor domain-containing protein
MTWTLLSDDLNGMVVNALLVDPISPTTLYAGTQKGVFVSEDGGISWQPLDASLPSLDVRSLAIDPASGRLYAGTWGGGVFILR